MNYMSAVYLISHGHGQLVTQLARQQPRLPKSPTVRLHSASTRNMLLGFTF
jgi:hypothetical protein